MGRGKRRSQHHGVLAVPVGAKLGRYAGLTDGAEAGDTCERECKTHGLTTHVLIVERGTGGKRWRCRQCLNDSARVSRLRKERKRLLVEEAGGKCVRCGYDVCVEALQFHHRDPAQKSFGLTVSLMTRHSLERLREEAQKCDLVCSNCHSEIEHELDSERRADQALLVEEEGKLYGDCGVHGRTELFLSEGGTRKRCKLCNLEAVRRARHKNKERLIEEFGGKCVRCGYGRYRGALEFHHRDPETKSFSIAKAGSIAYARLRDEAEKCDLLCSNCHAEHHAAEATAPSKGSPASGGTIG